jgi:hypothetical protein
MSSLLLAASQFFAFALQVLASKSLLGRSELLFVVAYVHVYPHYAQVNLHCDPTPF